MNKDSIKGRREVTRKEQKEMRQKQILIKALELFVTKGYFETKISDISNGLNMSMGLLFHYYDSKEQLYLELVKMGVEETKISKKIEYKNPLEYFKKFLEGLFKASTEQPWICQMFLLMSQAQRFGTPDKIRQLALSINQIELSSKIIEDGQRLGFIKKGDPLALSTAFWCSIQGIMEQKVISPNLPLPEVDWILDILRIERKDT